MNKLSLILLSLSIFFPLNNTAMDLNLATTINTNFINKQNNLAVPAIIVKFDNPNPLKRTHEDAFNSDITKPAKKQCLENKNLTSNTKKKFICTECNKTFTEKGNLTKHLRRHTGEKSFTCTFDGCNKSFAQKGNLSRHLKMHAGEKPYTCTFNGCNKSFSQKGNLSVHVKTHTNERPFTCTECNATFTLKGNLTKHLRTHTGEKPFMCTFNECNATFTQQDSLKRHLITHANKLDPQDIKY